MPAPVQETAAEKRQFAKRLKKLRKKLGFRQPEMAEFLGISLPTVRNIEQCNHGASHKTVLAVKQAEDELKKRMMRVPA